MFQPKALFKGLLAAAVLGTVVAAAPRTSAVRLDCPVLPLRVWCNPNECKNAGCVVYYCERLWTWDEYHFVVDIKADSIDASLPVLGAHGLTALIQMVDTPHVGLVTPTPTAAPASAVRPPSLQISDAALAWSTKMGGNDTSFVLWRDTLGLDVTTVSPAQTVTTPQPGSPPPTATPTPTVTVLWHGTCVAAKQQLPAVTPTPRPAPGLIPVSVPAQVKALKSLPPMLEIDFIDPKPPLLPIAGDLYVRDRESDQMESFGIVVPSQSVRGPILRIHVEPSREAFALLIHAKDPVLEFGDLPEFGAKRALVKGP